MDENELEDIAGEYVLGTLSAEEREEAEARLESDAYFAALVRAWEERLAPLAESAAFQDADVVPPDDVWDEIHARLDALPDNSLPQNSGPAAPALLTGGESVAPEQPSLGGADAKVRPRETASTIINLQKSRDRWRAAAIGAAALAASFIGLQALGVNLPYLPKPQPEGRYVAVLNPKGEDPGFLIRVDVGQKRLAIERLVGQAPTGKDYELWLIEPDQAPKSLNVVGRDKVQQVALPSSPGDRPVQFAVTLEPEGGSPTGKATGPIVFSGQLLTAE